MILSITYNGYDTITGKDVSRTLAGQNNKVPLPGRCEMLSISVALVLQ
jgi:hypothetical protein